MTEKQYGGKTGRGSGEKSPKVSVQNPTPSKKIKMPEIEKNIPIDFNLKKCFWGEYNKEKVTQIFKNLEFYSLIEKLPRANDLDKEEPARRNLRLW